MIVPLVREWEWRCLLDGLPSWRLPSSPTLVISPHPDDETLGAGGLIAGLRLHGIEVTVIAVTDGENAYAASPGLDGVRQREQVAALAVLGVDAEHIQRLSLPDSCVTNCEDKLAEHLLSSVNDDMHIVAPWRGDFHPDHEACGRAAEAVAKIKGVPLTSYFFWTWHRGTPESLHGLELVSFPLSDQELYAKQTALLCHRSQLEHEGGSPVLPECLLEPVNRPFEVFLPI